MKQDMIPVFTVLVEGNNSELCDLLHPLPFAYEAYIDTRMQLFDDDAEASSGSILVNTILELAQVLTILTAKKSVSLKLHVSAGERSKGFRAILEMKRRDGEWYANEQEVTKAMGSAVQEIRRIITAVEDGTDWQHPTQPCLDATDMQENAR